MTMRRYTIEVVIEEGSDEFWENLLDSGADVMLQVVKDALSDFGLQEQFGVTVKLKKFEDVER